MSRVRSSRDCESARESRARAASRSSCGEEAEGGAGEPVEAMLPWSPTLPSPRPPPAGTVRASLSCEPEARATNEGEGGVARSGAAAEAAGTQLEDEGELEDEALSAP